jgi:hypothetical protein
MSASPCFRDWGILLAGSYAIVLILSPIVVNKVMPRCDDLNKYFTALVLSVLEEWVQKHLNSMLAFKDSIQKYNVIIGIFDQTGDVQAPP